MADEDTPCEVIDGIEVANDLQKAFQEPDATHEVAKVLLDEASGKFVAYSFPTSWDMEAKVNLVRTMAAAQRKFFTEVAARIETEMVTSPQKAALIRRYAIYDSRQVEQLKRAVFAEKAAEAESAEQHLRRAPSSSGIRGRCATACREAIDAAHGINVFD
jgi:hypothetical protein